MVCYFQVGGGYRGRGVDLVRLLYLTVHLFLDVILSSSSPLPYSGSSGSSP